MAALLNRRPMPGLETVGVEREIITHTGKGKGEEDMGFASNSADPISFLG